MRFDSPDALLDAVGTELGSTEWMTIEQQRIDTFADATGDHQWIHVDPERAASGPFGGTIAHGFLTLSLLAPATFELLQVDHSALVVNAGTDRVRFITPVRSGSRIRMHGTIKAAERIALGVRLTVHVSTEIDGAEKPALVADSLMIFAPESAP